MTRALPLRLLRSPLLLLALGALTLSACDGNEPDPCDVPANCRPDVLVANQGNFTEANGTLAAYNPASGAVDSTAALGSLLQSVTQGPDGFFYVTANTAGRVDVFDAAAGGVPTRVGQIAVQAPRYVAFVSRQKAYVTTQLYDAPSLVTIINPQTQAATGTIEVGGFAEGITVLGDRAYVATGAFSATQEVVVIETETDAVIDRIDVGCNPRLVLSENAGIPPLPVFVVCSGAADDEIVVLNGETGAELRRISVGGAINTAGPGQDASLAFVEGLDGADGGAADGDRHHGAAGGGDADPHRRHPHRRRRLRPRERAALRGPRARLRPGRLRDGPRPHRRRDGPLLLRRRRPQPLRLPPFFGQLTGLFSFLPLPSRGEGVGGRGVFRDW